MTPEEEKRENVIQGIVDVLREVPFTVEFKVKKKPTGIKVIYEVTQEQMKEIKNYGKENNKTTVRESGKQR